MKHSRPAAALPSPGTLRPKRSLWSPWPSAAVPERVRPQFDLPCGPIPESQQQAGSGWALRGTRSRFSQLVSPMRLRAQGYLATGQRWGALWPEGEQRAGSQFPCVQPISQWQPARNRPAGPRRWRRHRSQARSRMAAGGCAGIGVGQGAPEVSVLRGWSALSSPAQPLRREKEAIPQTGQVGRLPLPSTPYSQTQKPWGLSSNLPGCHALGSGLSLPTRKTSSLPQAEQKEERSNLKTPDSTTSPCLNGSRASPSQVRWETGPRERKCARARLGPAAAWSACGRAPPRRSQGELPGLDTRPPATRTPACAPREAGTPSRRDCAPPLSPQVPASA